MKSALRKLAIRLACVHAEDRDWVLDQLSPVERQQMDELIHEIGLLGLATDPSVVNAVIGELDKPKLPSPVAGELDDTVHPFWLALALQSQDVEVRERYLDARVGGKPELLKWHRQFHERKLPPALLHQLQSQVRVRGRE